MQIKTVFVYARQDAQQQYLKEADETFLLEGTSLNETYLNIAALVNAAKATGSEAIHPGYGFLSENPLFSKACRDNGIVFIGPSGESMEAMGNKIAAREKAIAAGVPVTPGITGTPAFLEENFQQIGFPLLLKAAAGGGGKGMRVVQDAASFKNALTSTAREALNYFGDDTVYIEKYIEAPRHVEVQVLGDHYGNVIHLYDRECSLQRRHQKIVEEATAPTLSPEIRDRICTAAVQLAKSIHYESAGTLEFLLSPDMHFYFLEMNTRIQVEHPVTELITGIDIVEQQIRVAKGEKLSIQQQDIQPTGHAIECRIYAEDPGNHFLPAPGRISYYKEPGATNMRIDGMLLQNGDQVSGDFDPMISKLITWGHDRESARLKMLEALNGYFIYGIKSNTEFLTGLLQHPDFIRNRVSTKYIDEKLHAILSFIEKQKSGPLIPLAAALVASLQPVHDPPEDIWGQVGYWRMEPTVTLRLSGTFHEFTILRKENTSVTIVYKNTCYTIHLHKIEEYRYALLVNTTRHRVHIVQNNRGTYTVRYNGFDYSIARNDILEFDDEIPPLPALTAKPGMVTAPMPGKITRIAVKKGDKVQKGELLIIVEAMKMENNIVSTIAGTVTRINVHENDKVDTNTILVDLQPVE